LLAAAVLRIAVQQGAGIAVQQGGTLNLVQTQPLGKLVAYNVSDRTQNLHGRHAIA
jgi:hypothetical protein